MSMYGKHFEGYVLSLRASTWRGGNRGEDAILVRFREQNGTPIVTDGGLPKLSSSPTFLLPYLDNNVFVAQFELLKCSLMQDRLVRIYLRGDDFDDNPYIEAVELA